MRLHRPVSSECILTLGFGHYPPSFDPIALTPDHLALDFAPPPLLKNNTFNIFAAADGIVLHTGFNTQAGYFIVISHISPQNLLLTSYHHLEKIRTFRGSSVSQGDIIAEMGNTGISTGKHLHFAFSILYLQSIRFIDPTPHFTS